MACLDKQKRGILSNDTANGMYDVGEEFGVNNVVIVSDGNLGRPSIERVYRIDLDNKSLIYEERTFIHYAEETFGRDAREIIDSRYGQKLVAVYTQDDVQAYSEIRARGSRQQGSGGEAAAGNRKVQRGRGRNRGESEESQIRSSHKDTFQRIYDIRTAKRIAEVRIRSQQRQRYEQQIETQKQKSAEKLRQVRDQRDQKLQEQTWTYQDCITEDRAKRKERDEATKYRAYIMANARMASLKAHLIRSLPLGT